MAPDESIARQILAASAAEPPKLAAAVSVLAPLTKPLRVVLGFTVDYVVPVYVGAFKLGYRVNKLMAQVSTTGNSLQPRLTLHVYVKA